MPRLVIIGPPGSGKSTVAKLLASDYCIVHLSTGQLLRDEIKRGTEAGLVAHHYLSQGHLAPTPLVNGILRERLATLASQGFILDGYPRTVEQVDDLDKLLAELGQRLDAALLIDIPEETAVTRLSNRLVCLDCRSTYTQASVSPGASCANCGGRLVRREDDRPEVIRERFEVYHDEMGPVLDYYRQRGLLLEVDGAGEVEAVYARIRGILGTRLAPDA
jgi:adenylate kinase